VNKLAERIQRLFTDYIFKGLWGVVIFLIIFHPWILISVALRFNRPYELLTNIFWFSIVILDFIIVLVLSAIVAYLREKK